jgi:hypothetical protein
MSQDRIIQNKKEHNEFTWGKLSRGKLECLYDILTVNDTGTHPLIHDMRCELRNFFYDYDRSMYKKNEGK